MFTGARAGRQFVDRVEINDHGYVAIGVDIGGTLIKFVLVDNSGAAHCVSSLSTPKEPQTLARTVEEGVARLMHGCPKEYQVLDTVGLDIPGIVDEKRGIATFSADLGWRDLHIKDLIAQHVRRPVVVGHDVRSGAMAESRWGCGYPDFLFLAIETGISSVIVVNGESATIREWAGEIGQILVPAYDDEIVPLERVCSASGIGEQALRAGLLPDNRGSKQVYELVDCGNREAKKVTDFAVNTLAKGLAPVIAALGPIPLVLSGGLIKRGDRFCDELREAIVRNLGVVPCPKEIMPAKLGTNAQVRGAALRAFIAEHKL